MQRVAKWPLWLIGTILVLATLIPIVNSNAWWVRNLIFPQAQITACIVVVLVVAVIVLNRRKASTWLLAGGLGACTLYQLFYLLPYTSLAGTTVAASASCPADRSFSLIELNVRASNPHHDAVLSLVRRQDPDIVFAVETDFAWQRALQPLRARYPHVVTAARNDYWGMMLFSKLPLADAQVQHLVDDYVPSIRAIVTVPSGDRFVFHGLHPRPPMEHGSAKGDAEVVKAGADIAHDGRPALLTGDLNDVPWSSTIQLFQRFSNVADPRVGRGFFASFDADSRIARWPLDHIFVTPDFRVSRYGRLGDVGSDHFPMLAKFCLRPGQRRLNRSKVDDDAKRSARQIIRTGNRTQEK